MGHKLLLICVLPCLAVLMIWTAPASADWGEWTSGGEAVCTEATIQQEVKSASDDSGNTYLAWMDNRTGQDWYIYAQKLDPAGNPLWTPASGVRVNYPALYESGASTLELTYDGNGGLIVAYIDSYGDALSAQKIDEYGNLAWNGGSNVVISQLTMNHGISSIDLIPDGSGGIILSIGWVYADPAGGWYDYYSSAAVQKVDSNGNLLWGNTDPLIPGPGLSLAGFGDSLYIDAHHCNPRLCSNGSGGAIVAWKKNDYVFAAEVGENQIEWSGQVNINHYPDTPFYYNLEQDTNSPQIVSDGSDGAFISWNHLDTQLEGDDWYELYCQRIDSDGNPQWAHDIRVSEGIYPLIAGHQVITDSAAGAIYVFGSFNPNEDYNEIWAQRVDGSGSRLWPTGASGVKISDYTMFENQLSTATDGSGGVVVAWSDTRNPSDRDIYAQRVNSSGSKLWDEWGFPICSESAHQVSPDISSYNNGNIIAWQDKRSDTGDIYAQRMDNCYLEISNVAVNTTFDSQSYTWDAEFTFETNDSASSVVSYDPDMDCYPSCSYSHSSGSSEGTSHTVLLTGLEASNEYCYKISATLHDCTAEVTGSFPLDNVYDNIYGINADHNSITCGIRVSWYTKFPSKQNTLYYREQGAETWNTKSASQSDCSENRYYSAHFAVTTGTTYDYKVSTTIDNVTYNSDVDTKMAGRCDSEPPIPVRNSQVGENQQDLTAPFLRSHPNPFNPSTAITFNLTGASEIDLKIYSAAGKYVKTLASGYYSKAVHQVTWDGKNMRGENVASGIYFARLTIGGSDVMSSKLILLR